MIRRPTRSEIEGDLAAAVAGTAASIAAMARRVRRTRRVWQAPPKARVNSVRAARGPRLLPSGRGFDEQSANCREDRVGVLFDLAVGEPDDAVPGECQRGVAPPILLERRRRRVRRPPVDL